MKPFWKSKTFWGAVIAALPVPGAPVIAAAVSAIPGVETVESVPPELQAIIAGLGALLAIYGRFKATGQLTLK